MAVGDRPPAPRHRRLRRSRHALAVGRDPPHRRRGLRHGRRSADWPTSSPDWPISADAVQGTRPAHEWLRLLQDAAATLFAVDPDSGLAADPALPTCWRTSPPRPSSGPKRAASASPWPTSVNLLGSQPPGHRRSRRLLSRRGHHLFPHAVCAASPTGWCACSAWTSRPSPPDHPNGDDLTTADPRLGDRDRRSDARQSLLETVLAARQHLVVIRSGRSVVTNQPVPAAVVVAELLGVVTDTIDPAVRQSAVSRLTITHPRQSFDERNFGTVGSPSVERRPRRAVELRLPWPVPGPPRAWSSAQAPPFLAAPLADTTPAVIALADLREFLVNPPRWFLRSVLEVSLPEPPVPRHRQTGRAHHRGQRRSSRRARGEISS